MSEKILIPTKLINEIRIVTNAWAGEIKGKQKFKLEKKLIELWFFIWKSQLEDAQITNLKQYTNIHSRDLGKFKFYYSDKKWGYNKLLQLLQRRNLISINSKSGKKIYSSGKFSIAYRIETQFINLEFEEIELDFPLIYNNFKPKEFWLEKYPLHVKQINDAYDVQIDLNNYILWLKENIGLELKKQYNSRGFLVSRVLDETNIWNYINSALKINFKNLWFKVSESGRFYSSLTNLHHTAIPFILLRKRKPIELDIANAQPLLLSHFLKSEEFRSDCELGLFYDKLSKEMNLSRHITKLQTFRYIFFTKNELKSGNLFRAFQKIYPDLISEINEIKVTKNLALELQKLESSIFVEGIGKLNFNMMLRHDAVFVFEEDVGDISESIKSEFQKIGLNPKIKIKKLYERKEI